MLQKEMGERMPGVGTLVNVLSILLGGFAGLILKKAISKRIMDTVMQGVGLAVIIIGISGALSAAFTVEGSRISSEHTLIMILSLAVGALFGELMKIESKLEGFGKYCESKLTQPGEASSFAQGFVTATLVFCVGSMAIVGSLEDGIHADSSILIAKSALDGIAAMVFASTMGPGVLFSAVSVGVYQGLVTLLAIFVAPYLSPVVIAQMSLVGSVLIMGIGTNMLRMTQIKVGNMLPAVLVPIVYHIARSFL